MKMIRFNNDYRRKKVKRPPLTTISEIARANPELTLNGWMYRFEKCKDDFEIKLNSRTKVYYDKAELEKWAASFDGIKHVNGSK